MPGFAFDPQCRRLGHGKGFYDEFLSKYHSARVGPAAASGLMPHLGNSCPLNLKAQTDRLAVGLSLSEQLVAEGEEIPITKDDWYLDTLVLGDGSVRTRSELGSGGAPSDGALDHKDSASSRR